MNQHRIHVFQRRGLFAPLALALGGLLLLSGCATAPSKVRAKTHFERGDQYYRQHEFSKATTEYREAVRLKPDYFEAYHKLGLALWMDEKLEEGEVAFRKVIELNPDFAPAYYNLGLVIATRGKTEEAIKEYRKYLKFKPGDRMAHDDLGRALSRQGKSEEAIAEFRESIRLQVDSVFSPSPYTNLVLELEKQGKTEEAMAVLREAMKISPEVGDFNVLWGQFLDKQGKRKEARQYYEKALNDRSPFNMWKYAKKRLAEPD